MQKVLLLIFFFTWLHLFTWIEIWSMRQAWLKSICQLHGSMLTSLTASISQMQKENWKPWFYNPDVLQELRSWWGA